MIMMRKSRITTEIISSPITTTTTADIHVIYLINNHNNAGNNPHNDNIKVQLKEHSKPAQKGGLEGALKESRIDEPLP